MLRPLSHNRGRLHGCHIEDDKTVKLTASASDGALWVSKVADAIALLEKDAKHVLPLKQADEEETTLRKQARDAIASLRRVSKPAARGAELLLSTTLLNSYCTEEEGETDGNALEV